MCLYQGTDAPGVNRKDLPPNKKTRRALPLVTARAELSTGHTAQGADNHPGHTLREE